MQTLLPCLPLALECTLTVNKGVEECRSYLGGYSMIRFSSARLKYWCSYKIILEQQVAPIIGMYLANVTGNVWFSLTRSLCYINR